MKSRGAKPHEVDPAPALIILLGCLAVAMFFATLALGFVSLSGGPKLTAPAAGLAPPKLEPPVETAKRMVMDLREKKALEDALAKVGQQGRELDREKRKLALQQQTLRKSRATLADLQKQLRELARQASEKTRNMSQIEIQRSKIQGDSETRMADARRRIADADRRAEELRKEIHEKKTLFDPQGLAAANPVEEKPQWVECVSGAVVLIPQGDRIAVDRLKTAPAYVQAVKDRYVVFLVRPNGFGTFGSARAAAEENGAKRLGYEPINQNWQLKYR